MLDFAHVCARKYLVSLKPDPRIGVLGATLGRTDKFQSQPVQFIMVSAKKSILQKWKEESGIRELSSEIQLEVLRYHLIKKAEVHTKIWNPFQTFMAGNISYTYNASSY